MRADQPAESGDEKPSRRRILVRIAKWLIAIAVAIGLFFAVQTAIDGWRSESEKLRSEIASLNEALEKTSDSAARDQLLEKRERLQANIPSLRHLRWQWIGLASLLYGLALFPPGLLLHRALRSLGEHPRLSTAVAAQMIGHLGKYVPGKAMVIVLRSGALSKDGVRVVPATISVFMETFLMMAVGAAVAGVIIGWLPIPGWMTAMAIVVAILASLPTFPPVLKRVAARVTQTETSLGSMEAFGVFAVGWICSIVSWALIGGSFTALIYAIPSTSPLPSAGFLYAIATAAISLAMVAGFASLLPGGAGVRELVLATILGVSIGAAHGLLAAIAARLVFIAVEAVLGLAAWLWLRRG